MQIDNRRKSFYFFGKSMKNYSISMWIYEILWIILNFFGGIGIIIYFLFPYNIIDTATLNFYTFNLLYGLFIIFLILLYLLAALINLVYYGLYLMKLSKSAEYDQYGNLKKSLIMEITYLVLSIVLPITFEVFNFLLALFIPTYDFSFIIPNINNIQYDLTYTALIVSIIVFVLRLINGYIPRIFKAIAQKNLRKWTEDLFEYPNSEKEEN
ncbi:MAG: hypothetical protein ACTSXK_11420, partial [Promethearchaeota archaeon]